MKRSIAETTVSYNHRAKQWHAVNGTESISYPAGPEGKRQAQLYALSIDRPDLATKVHMIAGAHNYEPSVLNMAIKSAHIITDNLLHGNGVVTSQSREGIYHEVIEFSGIPKAYRCTCEAFTYHPVWIVGLGYMCKHGLATHIAYLLNIKLTDQTKEQNYA